MAEINDTYDIVKAIKAIEDELISSMIANLDHHRAEEIKEKRSWSQWQVVQLQALEEYKKRNSVKYGTVFDDINKQIDVLISMQRQAGNSNQEEYILNAIKNGAKLRKPSRNIAMEGAFFKLNDRKINALIEATVKDMKKGETAILRMANDKYRQVIFNAQVYAASGASYAKAVDMATKDYLRAGINCIEYSNGSRHTLSEYADMAIRTAQKRAYLTGEGEKRQEWGIHTVIMNKRLAPCPKCLPFVGKILIDDVWSGGSSKDGPYPLMSKAIAAGLYHPRCQDVHTTYFEGVSKPPDDKFSREELEQLADDYNKEQKQQYAERQAEKYERLSKYSLDKDNQRKYAARAEEWQNANNKVSFIELTQKYETNDNLYISDVKELQEYIIDGKKYSVDNVNVMQSNSDREIEVAEILSAILGKTVNLVPEIKGIYKNVHTPDYLIDGERWDLKELKEGTSKELLRNIVHKKKGQTDNFVFDITECKLSEEEIFRQAECLFTTYYNTKHINGVIILKEDRIVKYLQKNREI